jgi:hypothetical protein
MDGLDRTLNAGDARWLSAMAEPVCPFIMDLSETSGMRGLLELERAGLVRAVDELWEVTAVMDDLSAALSVPVALGTLFSRPAAEPRMRRQLTAFRGMGRLCVAAFTDLDAARPKVLFEDSSWPDLDLRLAGLLDGIGGAKPATQAGEQPSTTPASVSVSTDSEAEPEKTRVYCTNCGSEMDAGNAFCSSCGAPAATTAASGGEGLPAKKRHKKLWLFIGIGVVLLLPINSDAKLVLLLFTGILWGVTALVRRVLHKKK